ncbi:MAG: glycosyltransferase [Parabacteroides sp.]|nr:glycosyltransferase [Parabacteroides sp.]
MKLSIIVPVYNVEQYLETCLQSLYQQSFSTECFEVVIVNDGSTDNSMDIVRRYMGIYDNIRLIEQINQGLSVARNNGAMQAVGDYLLFVDSDDFLFSDSIPSLLSKALDNDLDVLRAEYQNCGEEGTLLRQTKLRLSKVEYENRLIDGDLLYQHVLSEEFFVPLFLIKRSFFLSNNLSFEEGRYFEDIIFTLQLSLAAKRVMYVSDVFYVYRLRNNSITHSINKKKMTDLVSIIIKMKQYSMDTVQSMDTRHVLEENITHLSVCLFLRVAEFALKDRRAILTPLLTNHLYPLIVNGGVKEKIISLLFNLIGINVVVLLAPIVRLKEKVFKRTCNLC